jgi:hypothetical protein
MPKNRHVLQVSTSVVLTTIHNTILCNHSSPITLTLPLPISDGINYNINRNDSVSVNTVTLNPGVNLIINGTISSSTFIISPQTYTEIISYNNSWYITYNIITNPLDTYGIFSTTFVANNTTPYMPLTGSSSAVVAYIPYAADVNKPNFISVCLTWVSSTPTGNFKVILYINTLVIPITVATLPVAITSSPSTAIFTGPIGPFTSPNPINAIRILWEGNSGANDKLGLNFVRLI